jgi:hypothetical protein
LFCDDQLGLSVEVATAHLALLFLFLVVDDVVHLVVDHVVSEHITFRTLELSFRGPFIATTALANILLVNKWGLM